MKQIDIINAYDKLGSLADVEGFHSKEQWALYMLRKELRSSIDFYAERSNAIQEKYIEFADSDGVLTGQKYQEFMAEMEELNNLDVDGDFKKISLPFVDGISFATAEALEKFVEFKYE